MKIQYIRGDLLESTAPYILHGCNAQGAMGSGVALAIRKKWPQVYQVYRDHYQNQGLNPGDVIPVQVNANQIVFNGITQRFYGPGDKLYLSYDALEQVISAIDHTVTKPHGEPPVVALPRIGAGLAGGDWTRIAEIIEKSSENFQPHVYVLD